MSSVPLAIAVAIGAVLATGARAQLPVYVDRFAADPAAGAWRGEPIVPGCAVAGCCPRCPDGWPVDWRIRVTASDIDVDVGHFELRFEAGAPDSLTPLVFERAEASADGSTVNVAGSEAWIRNFRFDAGARLPVAVPHFVVDPEKMRAFLDRRRPPDTTPRGEPLGKIELAIDQIHEGFLVNRFRWGIVVGWAPPITFADRIDLQGLAGTDRVFASVDGKQGVDCVASAVYHGVDPIPVGNFLSPTGCRSEVAVFSKRNAFRLIENVTAWTDTSGDLITVALKPRIEVPTRVWSLDAARPKGTVDGYFNVANAIYCGNRAGVRFVVTGFQDLVGEPGIDELVVADPAATCQKLALSPHYDLDALNVYFIDEGELAWGMQGFFCPDWDNVVVVAASGGVKTLAHELGHALSLRHVSSVPDFDGSNLMWSAGSRLTLGQVFRANVDPISIVNRLGLRAGEPTRRCPHVFATDGCPPESFDPEMGLLEPIPVCTNK